MPIFIPEAFKYKFIKILQYSIDWETAEKSVNHYQNWATFHHNKLFSEERELLNFRVAEKQTYYIHLMRKSWAQTRCRWMAGRENKSRIKRNKSQIIMYLCFSISFSCQMTVIIGLWISHARLYHQAVQLILFWSIFAYNSELSTFRINPRAKSH